VASFLARSLGGPYEPEDAGERAAATEAQRIPDAETAFAGTSVAPGGFRTLASVALPGATRRLPEQGPELGRETIELEGESEPEGQRAPEAPADESRSEVAS